MDRADGVRADGVGGEEPVRPPERGGRLTGEMGLYRVSSGKMKLKDETKEKANDLFQDIKRNVLQKLQSEGYASRLWGQRGIDDFGMSINFSTGAILVRGLAADDTDIDIDITSMKGLGKGGEGINLDLVRSVDTMRSFLHTEDLADAGDLSVVARDYSIAKRFYVGAPNGRDGFKQHIGRLKGEEQRVMRDKDRGLLGKLTGAVAAEDRRTNPQYVKAEQTSTRAFAFVEGALDLLRNAKEAAEEEKAQTNDREELQLIDDRLKAIDGEIGEYQSLLGMKNMLHATAAVTGVAMALDEADTARGASAEEITERRWETADGTYNWLLAYFKGKNMGVSQMNKDTGLPETFLTKRHRDLAALIAATSVYNRNDSLDRAGNIEHNRTNKVGFTAFLESKMLHPDKVHLGKTGVIIRLLNTGPTQARGWLGRWVRGEREPAAELVDNIETLVDSSKFLTKGSGEETRFKESLLALHERIVTGVSDVAVDDEEDGDIGEAENVRQRRAPQNQRENDPLARTEERREGIPLDDADGGNLEQRRRANRVARDVSRLDQDP